MLYWLLGSKSERKDEMEREVGRVWKIDGERDREQETEKDSRANVLRLEYFNNSSHPTS